MICKTDLSPGLPQSSYSSYHRHRHLSRVLPGAVSKGVLIYNGITVPVDQLMIVEENFQLNKIASHDDLHSDFLCQPFHMNNKSLPEEIDRHNHGSFY